MALIVAAQATLLVQVFTAMQPLDDLGGLQHFALSRRVRRDVARPSHEDVVALLRVPPFLVLLHGGFQHLISVEVGVFAHDGSHERANQRPAGWKGGKTE